jgi:hypothetical protein
MTTRVRLGALLAIASSSLGAQNQPAAGPPIRRIATASAVSTEPLGQVSGVRELPGGRLLLNDGGRRRLLLMDSSLKVLEVVLDSLAEVENSYGTRQGALIAYRGDSTLFVDQASYAMLVIDPAGKVVRVRSVPRVEDAGRISGGDGSRSGVDAKGRVVYRIQARPGPPKVAPPRGVPWFPQDPDSAFVVGIDLETRKIDTLASYRIPKSLSQVRRSPNGGFNFYEVVNPLPSTDEWAVLSDGTVAFLRGVDYRVDYLLANGTWTSSPKLPYDWQRVTEEDKERIIDSVKADRRRASMNSFVQSMMRWVNQYGKEYPDSFTVPQGYRLQNGLARDWRLPRGLAFPDNYIYACAPGETPTMRPDSSAPQRPQRESRDSDGGPPGAPSGIPSCIPGPVVVRGGNAPPAPTIRDVGVMQANELPDYRPPFGQGAVRADADGNLWIRPNLAKPVPGGAVFDIVSRQGELVDRLQVPPGHAIAGFGVGKVVYLSIRDAGGVKLARVRLR